MGATGGTRGSDLSAGGRNAVPLSSACPLGVLDNLVPPDFLTALPVALPIPSVASKIISLTIALFNKDIKCLYHD